MPPSLYALFPRLKESEGWRSHVYLDTTGNLTIGWGHNLAKLVLPPGVKLKEVRLIPVKGITLAVGEILLREDLLAAIAELRRLWPWSEQLDEVRQQVLADMAFNVPAFMSWPIFTEQVRSGAYVQAAANMRATLWARQVGARAQRLASMMETGKEQA